MLFRSLKANGKYFFKEDGSQNQVPTKEITLTYNSKSAQRYESKNIFVLINNKEYLFSVSAADSDIVVELLDLNDGNNISNKVNSPTNFFGNYVYSYVFSLLPLDTSPKQYIISYICRIHFELCDNLAC